MIQSGFAAGNGEDKLGPCPLGTFADSSLTHPNCKNCTAGKLYYSVFITDFTESRTRIKKHDYEVNVRLLRAHIRCLTHRKRFLSIVRVVICLEARHCKPS